MENNLTPKQALEEIGKLKVCFDGIVVEINGCTKTREKYDLISQALTELEEIKVFNESLQKDIDRLNQQCIDLHLKDSRQSQLLEVLKKKDVDVSYIKSCENYFDYTMALGLAKEDLQDGEFINVLTKTEFNLIKEWLK